jgi:hypothetical protein
MEAIFPQIVGYLLLTHVVPVGVGVSGLEGLTTIVLFQVIRLLRVALRAKTSTISSSNLDLSAHCSGPGAEGRSAC